MDWKSFTKGKGVDTSEKPLPTEVPHYYKAPDNLYSLKEGFTAESLDFVFNEGLASATKYFKILLKEWFLALKVNGHLIVRFKPNKLLSAGKLKEEVQLLFKGKARLVGCGEGSSIVTCVVQKTASALIPDDSIGRWTFGVITNGKREQEMERLLASIRKQNIPHYEIIVCGTYFERNEPDFRYIPFSEHDDKGWITRKKNIICENAKYENIMVLHDRLSLDDGWFEGMKRYGNNFEVLSCIQLAENSVRAADWVTSCCSRLPGIIALLDYRDWDSWIYPNGGLIILKKSVWKQVKWNESLFWNQCEDVELGHRFTAAGFVFRFNPHASCSTVHWRHGAIPSVKFNPRRFGGLQAPFREKLACAWIRLKDRMQGRLEPQ